MGRGEDRGEGDEGMVGVGTKSEGKGGWRDIPSGIDRCSFEGEPDPTLENFGRR